MCYSSTVSLHYSSPQLRNNSSSHTLQIGKEELLSLVFPSVFMIVPRGLNSTRSMRQAE